MKETINITESNGNVEGATIIGSSIIPQKNVKDLEDDLENIRRRVKILIDHDQATSMEIVGLKNDLYETKEILADSLQSIEKLTKESMIMFFMVLILFIIDLATIWSYIRK